MPFDKFNFESAPDLNSVIELIQAGATHIVLGKAAQSDLAEHQVSWLTTHDTNLMIIAHPALIYDAHAGRLICDALGKRWPELASVKNFAALAIHEMVLNAVEHGILQISSDLKAPDTAFDAYYETVRTRLQQADYGKPVALTIKIQQDRLHMSILDPGEGFDYAVWQREQETENTSLSGRGLRLCQNLALQSKFDADGQIFSIVMSLESDDHMDGTPEWSLRHLKKHALVMIVDDQPVNRQLARHFLEAAGFKEITEANNGAEALKMIQETPPAIILMDIMMPVMDGFELCEKLKAKGNTRSIPVLFMSGLTDAKSRTRGFQLGAVDYVNKPIDRAELIARVEVHIQSGAILQELRRYSQRVFDELSQARRIQQRLLPRPADLCALENQLNINLVTYFQSSSELSGDYWTTWSDKGKLFFLLADFVGHGVSAALETFRIHALVDRLKSDAEDLKSFTAKLNEELFNQLAVEQFATLLFGTLDPATGMVNYISHGSPAPVLIPDNQAQPIKILETGGLPLGLAPNDSFEAHIYETRLQPGDTMVLYSDALDESPHQDGVRWEQDGLIKAMDTVREQDGLFMRNLLRAFNRTAQFPLKDDLTLLSLQIPKN